MIQVSSIGGKRKLVIGWRGKHSVYLNPPTQKEEWNIEKLTARLVDKKIIPVWIQNDASLYALLIVQMELQLLRNLVVPKGVGQGNFYRNVETKGLRVGNVKQEKSKLKKQLEQGTGVNIDNWYKIEANEKKRKRLTTEKNLLFSKKSRFLYFIYLCTAFVKFVVSLFS